MPPSRRVLLHPDPLRLEEELADWIRRIKCEAGPWARVLVTAPSQRQVRRLRERLAEREGALLGVEVLQYQALAYRLLEPNGAAPSILSEAALDRLIERLLSRHPQFALFAYARERPGVLAELRARLEELREAGVRPADFTRRPSHRSPQTSLFAELDGSSEHDGVLRELSIVLEDFDASLLELERQGWTDRPGLARRAADTCALEFEAVFAYGAYEIVGVHLDLLNAVRSHRPLLFFVPADLTAPAWDHAREQARRYFGGTPEAIPDGASRRRPFVDAACRLHGSETSPPENLPSITFDHAQGPEAELTLAARRALALIRDGMPARDIAIVARSLEPYLALAESVFARHGLPVDASASLPLARHAEPRALLLLLSAIAKDFDRRTVTELVRSPHLKRPAWADGTPLWQPVNWERWSRSYGLTGGVDAWTVELPRLLRERSIPPWLQDSDQIAAFPERCEAEARSAEMLGRLVSDWAMLGDAWRNSVAASEHVAMLETLRRSWIKSQKGGAETKTLDRVWETLLEQLRGLEAVLEPTPLDRDTVLEFVMRSLEMATFASNAEDGVSFLDLRQARGLSFRHVFFIGMNDGLYPRPARETPLLPDRARAAIRDRTGRPLAVRREARAEERLLFAQLLASTRDALVVSWQRADAEGRALAPSLALRELGATLPGGPTLATLLKQSDTRGLPTEPTLAAGWLERETGLLLREEAALLSARHAPSAVRGVRAFLDSVEPETARELDHGLALIEATETGQDLRFDGAIQSAAGRHPYSASSLERISRCPLTFFFQDVLKARPLDQEAREYRTEAREIGQLVHGILENVYGELARAGLLEGTADVTTLQAAGRAALDAQWDAGLSRLAWRMNRRYPLLYATTARIWREELETFLEKDLARLVLGGHALVSLETAWSARLSLGAGFSIRGIPDRVTRDREGRYWISDYKTSGKLEKHTEAINYLRGEHVQLPLYVLMGMNRQGAVAPLPEAEIVGLGPNFFPDFGFVGRGPNRFDVERFMQFEDGFLETLSVLGSLVDLGRFPFRTDRHCRWCPFHLACRRHQLSSETRVFEHPDHARYFQMRKKSTQRPLLEGTP